MPKGRVTCGGIFDVEVKQAKILECEEEMSVQGFWDSQEEAQKVIKESNRLKNVINPIVGFQKRLDDVNVMVELIEEEDEDSAQLYLDEVSITANKMLEELDSLEIASFLSGPHDNCNAILSIHAGAGGTESCDWADMLLRQYTRWAERRNFDIEVQDVQQGEEAGISSATLRIVGENAYGYAKAERGVHRLVRISPFDSNSRRHTSFSSVDIIAEIEDDNEIEIKDEELRVDTYRASGKGGQHVNKTNSAVRLTHLPTNIVVTCQNERSQLKNRATAMRVLKSRIFEKKEDDKRVEMDRFYGDKGDISWGNQIRSYVFQPYQMVKDLRTGKETGNVQAVMDGDIDLFINAWLRAGCPVGRNNAIDLDD